MLGFFKHDTIRNSVIIFGSLFDDITVQRYDNNITHTQTLPVPIAYGPKMKFLVRLDTDPNLDRKIAISVPRIGFEITGLLYDSSRKLNTSIKDSYILADNTSVLTQYVPVPYNIDFSLSIFVKNADDGTQILEQILPYFRPEWSVTANMIPQMHIVKDIPIILNSVGFADGYDGDFLNRRALTWDLSFTMKTYLYGPVTTSGIITRAQIDFHPDIALNTARTSRIVVVPGLQANGAPTTNSAASIDRSLINADDDYGFAANTFFYSDGFVYNPVTGRDEK